MTDLSRCPKCDGPADNGHDREVPPNPYHCTKCMAELQGCDHCNHPLYAAIKCRVCGRVTEPPQDHFPDATKMVQKPVGIVSSLVKGGVVWQRWPADMPDGTQLFGEVQP